MEATCSVCFDKFNKARRQVVCPACPENLDAYPCTVCTQTYLLESTQAAHCMNCRHEWGQNFLYQTFPKTWLTGAYRKSRQQKSLEREKALLQETLPLVEVEKQKDAIRAEIRELRDLRSDILDEIRMVDEDIRVQEQKLQNGTGIAAKATVYTFPCPVMGANEEKCKGFIEAKTWKCGLCEEKICRSCHVQLPKDIDEETKVPAKEATAKSGKSKTTKAKKPKKHVCKEDDVATAKAIVKDTKPCPKCAARIYRIEGCPQMFCTAPNCHTAFDWNTGQIVTGIIHNPHYYELMRKMGTANRTPGDVPCGGLPHIFTLDVLIKTIGPGLGDDITRIHRLAGEIGDSIARLRGATAAGQRELERLRLWFLMGRIKTEEDFKRQIFLCERAQQKKKEELNILETFHTATIEAFNDLRGACADIDEKFNAEAKAKAEGKKTRRKQIDVVMAKTNAAITMIENIVTVIEFCNKAFIDNFKAMGYRSFPAMALGYNYPYKPGGRREQQRARMMGIDISDDESLDISD